MEVHYIEGFFFFGGGVFPFISPKGHYPRSLYSELFFPKTVVVQKYFILKGLYSEIWDILTRHFGITTFWNNDLSEH